MGLGDDGRPSSRDSGTSTGSSGSGTSRLLVVSTPVTPIDEEHTVVDVLRDVEPDAPSDGLWAAPRNASPHGGTTTAGAFASSPTAGRAASKSRLSGTSKSARVHHASTASSATIKTELFAGSEVAVEPLMLESSGDPLEALAQRRVRILGEIIESDPPSPCMDLWYPLVQSNLVRMWQRVLTHVLRYPKTIVFSVVAICLALSIGGLSGAHVRADLIDYAMESLLEQDRVAEVNALGLMPPPRISFVALAPGTSASSTITSGELPSVLTPEAFKLANDAYMLTMETFQHDGLSYPDVCYPGGTHGCQTRCVSQLLPNTTDAQAPILASPATFLSHVTDAAARAASGRTPLALYAGVTTDAAGAVTAVNGWTCYFAIKADPAAVAWSDAWDIYMETWRPDVYARSWNTAFRTAGAAMVSDFGRLIGMLVIVLLFVSLTTSGCGGALLPPFVSLIIVFNCLLASATGIGIYTLFSPQVCLTSFAVPLLVVSIGINDVFIMYEALAAAPGALQRGPALARAIKSSAAVITIATLVNVFSLLNGTWFPSWPVRQFAVIAAISMVVDVILQMTLVVACLSFSNHLYANPQRLCTARLWTEICRHAADRYRKGPLTARAMRLCVRKLVDVCLPNRLCHALAGVCLLILLCGGMWGAFHLNTETAIDVNAPIGSRMRATIAVETMVGGTIPYSLLVAFSPKVSELSKYQDLVGHLQALDSVAAVQSPIPGFLSWVQAQSLQLNDDSFGALLNTYFHTPDGHSYCGSTIFTDESKTKISALSIWVHILQTQRYVGYPAAQQLIESSELNTTLVAYLKLFTEGDLHRAATATRLCSLALASVLVVLAFCTRPDGAIFVVMSCACVDLGFVGFMWLTGFSLDLMSIVNLLFVMGFSVDFSVHVVHEYMEEIVGQRPQRLARALKSALPPILLASLTGMLVCGCLCFSNNRYFAVFGALNVAVVALCFLVSAFVLPVLLWYLGPPAHAVEGYKPGGMRHW